MSQTSRPGDANSPMHRAAVERSRVVTWEDPAAAAPAGAAMNGIEFLRAIVAGKVAAAPIARLMGFELDEVAEGRAVFAAVLGEHHYNLMGAAHGGLAATLLDSAMGCAVHTLLQPAQFYTTLEIKVNYVRPLKLDSGRVRAVGTVIHIGARTATAEGRIVDHAGRLYAHGTTTCVLLGR
jgi:uncharacterized protein (TIGR00369 family)